jgi:hypothetical protein
VVDPAEDVQLETTHLEKDGARLKTPAALSVGTTDNDGGEEEEDALPTPAPKRRRAR